MLHIGQVALLVHSYDEAINFYCHKVGFRVVEDTQLPSKRWVRLSSGSAAAGGTKLLLSKAVNQQQAAVVGNQAGGRVFLYLYTDDMASEVQRMTARGVQFTEAPRTEAYGRVAVFVGLYGNRVDLIEATTTNR